MTDYAKQLKQHQAEIESITKQLPQLKQTADHAMQVYASSRTNRPAYPHEAVDAYEGAKAAIEEHHKEAAQLQRFVEWEDNVKSAPASIKAARRTMDSTMADLRKLEEKRNKLAGKLEGMQASQRQELEAAQAREKEAASLYAEAMAAGDEAAERRAQAALEATAKAVEACKFGMPGSTAVVDALTVELEKLQEGIKDGKQRHDDARREVLLAARYLWAARLDKATHDLAMIAAHVSAADKALGRGDSMADLCLPLQAPDGPRYLGARYITEARAEIGIEQLTAA